MLERNGKEIYLTRGDTCDIMFPAYLKHADGTREPYEFEQGDKVVFRLAKAAGQPLKIEKECTIDFENSAATLYLEPSDTEDLDFGKYRYEVELQTGNERYTYIANQLFEIGNEVEKHE